MRKIFLVFLFFLSVAAIAQPPSGGPSGDPGPTGPDDIPIDGGIELLVAAGLLYGGKKLLDSRKRKGKR